MNEIERKKVAVASVALGPVCKQIKGIFSGLQLTSLPSTWTIPMDVRLQANSVHKREQILTVFEENKDRILQSFGSLGRLGDPVILCPPDNCFYILVFLGVFCLKVTVYDDKNGVTYTEDRYFVFSESDSVEVSTEEKSFSIDVSIPVTGSTVDVGKSAFWGGVIGGTTGSIIAAESAKQQNERLEQMKREHKPIMAKGRISETNIWIRHDAVKSIRWRDLEDDDELSIFSLSYRDDNRTTKDSCSSQMLIDQIKEINKPENIAISKILYACHERGTGNFKDTLGEILSDIYTNSAVNVFQQYKFNLTENDIVWEKMLAIASKYMDDMQKIKDEIAALEEEKERLYKEMSEVKGWFKERKIKEIEGKINTINLEINHQKRIRGE